MNKASKFQVVINGNRVISTHRTLATAERAASKLQAQTRRANPGGNAYLDLRIEAI